MSFRSMLISLIILFLCQPAYAQDNLTVYFIYSDLCPHCAQEKSYLKKIESRFPQASIEYVNIGLQKDAAFKLMAQYGLNNSGTPQTYVMDTAFIGFTDETDYLMYSNKHRAFLGNAYSIEYVIEYHSRGVKENVSAYNAVVISTNESLVSGFIHNNPTAYATVNLSEGVYFVGWFNRTRLRKGPPYPNIVALVNASCGQIIDAHYCSSTEPGVVVPSTEPMYSDFIAYIGIFMYLITYLIYSHSRRVREKIKHKISDRQWLIGFIILLAALSVLLVVSHPKHEINYLIKFLGRLMPIYL